MNHRFINADCYTDTGTGFLGFNMFAYCNNSPVSKIDPVGLWTVSISLSVNVTLLVGVSVGITISFDDDGNIAIQWGYSLPKHGKGSTGLADAGVGVTIQYNTADTVFDLEGLSTAVGFSLGDSWYGGIDFISNTYASDPDGDIDGIQLTIGYGVGLDVHINQIITNTIGSSSWKEIENSISSLCK